jgi:tRNA G10  N-methylase Trm11
MYLFLLGRDPKLSKLEIATYFYGNNVKYEVVVEDDRYILIETTKLNTQKIQEQLSGITRIAEIYHKTKEIDDIFLNKLEYKSKKFNYTISSIDLPKEELEYIENLLKGSLKLEKIKAVYKKPKKHGKKENYLTNPNNYYSWKIYDGFELFVIFVNNTYYFAKTITCFNPRENIFKDKNLPKRKELYSTSFRIADIMVNLLGENSGKTIIDPFCGTGTYLIEAMIKGYDVIGVDVDPQMCRYSKENIEWIKKKYSIKQKYQIIRGDSSKIKINADFCVFEPYMGPFLRKTPPEGKAKKIAKELENIYFEVFRNLSRNLPKKTKIVCILPEVPKYEGSIKITNNVFLKNGFVIKDVNKYNNQMKLENPIVYNTPDGSRIVRKIYILERGNNKWKEH